MATRALLGGFIIASCVLITTPATARAGDCPLLTVGQWGIGEIDNRILLYLGEDRSVLMPIPAPPEGPRWDLVYESTPWMAIAAGAIWLDRWRRRYSAVKSTARERDRV
jgi:hypothetical protein